MNGDGIRCWVLGGSRPPVAADDARTRFELCFGPVAALDPEGELEVAPGVHVRVLSWGDYYLPAERKTVSGALVAVRTAPGAPGLAYQRLECGAVVAVPGQEEGG